MSRDLARCKKCGLTFPIEQVCPREFSGTESRTVRGAERCLRSSGQGRAGLHQDQGSEERFRLLGSKKVSLLSNLF